MTNSMTRRESRLPKVSVIIPSYNHEKFVGAAIGSVFEQTLRDIELIVVEDASTDGSLRVIKSLHDQRLRYIVQPRNLGMSAAINAGISQASAPYIAVMGSDDIFLPGKLERQVAVLDAMPDVAVVFSLVDTIDENGQCYTNRHETPAAWFDLQNRGRQQWLAYMFQHGNCVCHPTSLMRRSCLDEIGYYDERLAQLQDFDMWLRVLKRYEIFILQEHLVHYRWLQSGGNTSAPELSRMSRIMWETTHVLSHYLDLAFDDLEAMYGKERIQPYRSAGLPPQMVSIDLAITANRSEYQLFGLNALHGLLEPYGRTTPMHCYLTAKARETDPLRFKALVFAQQQLAKITRPP